jgi:flavin-binding protein dodecin
MAEGIEAICEYHEHVKKEGIMTVSTYKIIEVVGTSEISWEDAAKNAVAAASSSLRDLRVAEVKELDLKIEKGKVAAYRARLELSFKYEG